MSEPRRVVWVSCPDCGQPQPRYEGSDEETRCCYECVTQRRAKLAELGVEVRVNE